MTNSKDKIAVTSEVGGSGMDGVGKGTIQGWGKSRSKAR